MLLGLIVGFIAGMYRKEITAFVLAAWDKGWKIFNKDN